MPERGQVVDFNSSKAANPVADDSLYSDYFLQARERVESCLIDYTLAQSYRRFCEAGLAYPFIEKERVFPEKDRRAAEMHPQNTALVILLDHTLPRSLNKYFRLRASNKVTWRNLRRLLPEEDHEEFKAAHCRLNAPEFLSLLQKLLPSDYALLIEQEEPETRPVLSHMHVKVERLTDIALREVGKQLGYIDRALFERGEDYVEELEAKFFEYHGFSANASGRKSAAAIAAQLFAKDLQRFSVFVASQTDNRLTHLSEGDVISQHFLVRLDRSAQEYLLSQAAELGISDLSTYWLDQFIDGAVVARMRVRYRRTAAALPAANRAKERDLTQPWIKLLDQTILSGDQNLPILPLVWVEGSAIAPEIGGD